MRGLIADAALPDYRAFMNANYAPKLRRLGSDPAAGAYARDEPDRQKLRQELVGLVAVEGADPELNTRLSTAARSYLAGEHSALDQAFMGAAFAAYVRAEGVAAAKVVADRALASEDPVFRSAALQSIGGTGRLDVAAWILGFNDPRLRPLERLGFLQALVFTAETKTLAGDWLVANYDKLAAGSNGIFISSRLPSALNAQCSVEASARIEATLGPKVRALGRGVLDFERTVENIRHCSDLKAARQQELTSALRAAS